MRDIDAQVENIRREIYRMWPWLIATVVLAGLVWLYVPGGRETLPLLAWKIVCVTSFIWLGYWARRALLRGVRLGVGELTVAATLRSKSLAHAVILVGLHLAGAIVVVGIVLAGVLSL